MLSERTLEILRGGTQGPWVIDDNEGYGATTLWAGMSPSGNGPVGRMIATFVGDDHIVEEDANKSALVNALAAVAVKVAAYRAKCAEADAAEFCAVADALDEKARQLLPALDAALAALDKAAMEVGR
jgi:hypothetical protein